MILTENNPKNALNPIHVTLFGIVIEVKEEHPLNALCSIAVTLLEMVIEVKEEQERNTKLFIFMTPSVILIEVKEEHPSKAYSPIDVIPSSITTDLINFLLLYQGTEEEEEEEKLFISPFPLIVNTPSARMALQSFPHSHSSHFTERRNIESTKVYFRRKGISFISFLFLTLFLDISYFNEYFREIFISSFFHTKFACFIKKMSFDTIL